MYKGKHVEVKSSQGKDISSKVQLGVLNRSVLGRGVQNKITERWVIPDTTFGFLMPMAGLEPAPGFPE